MIREYEQKRKMRRILSSPLILALLAIVLLFLINGAWNIWQKDRESSAALQSAEERLARLKDRQAGFQSAIANLQTESGVEAEIRDKFDLAKAGEREVVIVDGDSASTTQTAPPSESFLQKIWDFFTIR